MTKTYCYSKKVLLCCCILTSVLMYLVEGIFGYRKHANVGTELFDEDGDNVLRGGRAGDAYAFGGYFLTGVLKVIAHNTMEFEVLLQGKELERWRSIIMRKGLQKSWH